MAMMLIETFATPCPEAPFREAPPRAIAVAGGEPETLIAILRANTNLAIWHRPLPVVSARALQSLAAAAPFVATAEGEPLAALHALAEQLPGAAPARLLNDIFFLANAFTEIADTGGALRIRLEGITGPACHRWHADAVGLRLLCTYRGAGTLVLPINGGAAAARALPPGAPPVEPLLIPCQAVAILKGESHPGNARSGCIHRSPPAAPGKAARLLLCLDAPGRIPLE